MQIVPYSQAPYDKYTILEIADFVRNGKRLEIPNSVPSGIRELITACWHQDPHERPKFAKIIVSLNSMMKEHKPKESSLVLSRSTSAQSFSTNGSSSASPVPSSPEPMKLSASARSFDPSDFVIPVPPGDLNEIAWCGDISRKMAETRLEKEEIGTFLTRWSERQKSFVVSFKATPTLIRHIDSIWLNDNVIVAMRRDNTRKNFSSMLEYIRTLQKYEQISRPLSSIRVRPSNSSGEEYATVTI